MSNHNVLKEDKTQRKPTAVTRKRVILFGHTMRREALELVVKTGKIYRRMGRKRHREKFLVSFLSWTWRGVRTSIDTQLEIVSCGKACPPTPVDMAHVDDNIRVSVNDQN